LIWVGRINFGGFCVHIMITECKSCACRCNLLHEAHSVCHLCSSLHNYALMQPSVVVVRLSNCN
jgi:hypothetical protein